MISMRSFARTCIAMNCWGKDRAPTWAKVCVEAFLTIFLTNYTILPSTKIYPSPALDGHVESCVCFRTDDVMVSEQLSVPNININILVTQINEKAWKTIFLQSYPYVSTFQEHTTKRPTKQTNHPPKPRHVQHQRGERHGVAPRGHQGAKSPSKVPKSAGGWKPHNDPMSSSR